MKEGSAITREISCSKGLSRPFFNKRDIQDKMCLE